MARTSSGPTDWQMSTESPGRTVENHKKLQLAYQVQGWDSNEAPLNTRLKYYQHTSSSLLYPLQSASIVKAHVNLWTKLWPMLWQFYSKLYKSPEDITAKQIWTALAAPGTATQQHTLDSIHAVPWLDLQPSDKAKGYSNWVLVLCGDTPYNLADACQNLLSPRPRSLLWWTCEHGGSGLVPICQTTCCRCRCHCHCSPQ
jgi:hypothetical protein